MEIAPDRCIVCNKPRPNTKKAPPGTDWTYLSGSTPVGAMACTKKCADVAVERHKRTGRVDLPARDADPRGKDSACRCLAWPCPCPCHKPNRKVPS